MPKVISISQASGFSPSSSKPGAKQNSHHMTTADYRRLLSELQLRPPSQRAFLRKFLKRAAASGIPVTFPVTNPAVVAP
jgi:hypothetical protein